MGVGHALLAHRNAFLIGAALIVLGNGCFKPNVSTRVGRLYDRGDSRRDVAFGIFYCGINLGAAVAPVAAGMLHAADGYEAEVRERGGGDGGVPGDVCVFWVLDRRWGRTGGGEEKRRV